MSYLYVCGLVVGAGYITTYYDSSFAFERPLHSAIAIFFITGLLITLAERHRFLNLPASPVSPVKQYLPVPSDERFAKPLQSPLHSRHASADSAKVFKNPKWRRRIAFAVLILSMCARVPVTQAWLRYIQCSHSNVECLLPFILSVYELCSTSDATLRPLQPEEKPGPPLHVQIRIWCQDSRYTCALATLVFGLSAMVVLSRSTSPNSTYICSPNVYGSFRAVLFQLVGLVIDSCAAISIIELMEPSAQGKSGTSGVRAVGWATLLSSGVLAIIGAFHFIFDDHVQIWSISSAYAFSIIKMSVSIAVVIYCGLQVTLRAGLQQALLLGALSAVYTSCWLPIWNIPMAFQPSSERLMLSCLSVMVASFLFALESSTQPQDYPVSTSTRLPKRARQLIIGGGIVMCLTRDFASLSRTKSLPFHPIDVLILEAGSRQAAWEKANTWTGTLGLAVVNYRSRYGRSPPPNFDKWYEYATSRDSVVIDDFDNIHYDLLPFWSLSPSELRQQTSEDIAQIDNGIGGIVIRDHKAEVDPALPLSHRWMAEGFINMTKPFIQYLPDMDLALNLNDEGRTMVPYEDNNAIMRAAKAAFTAPPSKRPRNAFDYDKVTRWQKLENGSIDVFPMAQPFQPIFQSYGSAHCRPDSAARSDLSWQTQKLCTSCMTAHTHPLGPFPSNVSLAREVCHQPDLSYLHGFYSSPSTFKAVKQLRPTFSQSKAPGFADIRFPSPWNYVDKAAYAPTKSFPDVGFKKKKNTLFWRGATTEGFTPDDGRHVWQGMTRQRFVNAANFPSTQQVLLPTSKILDSNSSQSAPTYWRYQRLSASRLTDYFSTNVSMQQPIARCRHRDCADQVNLFNVTHPNDISPNGHTAISAGTVDFQAHWRYRYLFDMDGAGFSGRFIPFLKSRSLPIKTTGLFSEWWDGRVTEWWHYVPVDIRLCGLYSTLAYFMGVDTNGTDTKIEWKGKTGQAAKMAERGRVWANKVLRKEDMEIYLFRLLLEWGRLVDEGRDEIGFTL